MAYLTFEEINRLDIVDFLTSLGYQPKKIAGRSWWYLSMLPGRFESTPSFKVNRGKNKWIDFGYNAREHSLVDLGILLFNCTIRELVIRLSGPGATLPSVSRPILPADAGATRKLEVVRTYPLRSEYLLRYLWERRIPIRVAQKFCVEAEYTYNRKIFITPSPSLPMPAVIIFGTSTTSTAAAQRARRISAMAPKTSRSSRAFSI